MTTVAYRDGVLAADSLCSSEGMVVGSAAKAAAYGPLLVGVAGTLGIAQRFMDWLQTGATGQPPAMDGPYDGSATAMVILPDGLIATFDRYGVDRMKAPFHAIGSGWRLALGAMAAGATAEEAVRIAATMDCYTGGAIRVISRSAH